MYVERTHYYARPGQRDAVLRTPPRGIGRAPQARPAD